MFRLQLVPDNTHIDFLRFRTIAFAVSAAALIGSIGAFFALGLNFGIDFRGGITIEIGDEQPIDIAETRRIVGALNLGDVKVKEFGSPNILEISIEQQPEDPNAPEGAPSAGQVASERVQEALKEGLGEQINFRRIDFVGPVVSEELTTKGAQALAFAIAMMLVYIWLRFEWQFSLGAIAALVHDVILTIGFFSITQLEFNLQIIAAILTIIGYSMNDTVVVYDRVRENLRKYKKKPLVELLNLSVNETLSRTVMTSLTTLIALFALFFLGGEGLRGFSFAMIWGVIVGTYSSVFVAAPILLMTGVRSAPAEAPAEA